MSLNSTALDQSNSWPVKNPDHTHLTGLTKKYFPDQLFDRCTQRGMLNLDIILQVDQEQ
jgi:hypothetical protein